MKGAEYITDESILGEAHMANELFDLSQSNSREALYLALMMATEQPQVALGIYPFALGIAQVAINQSNDFKKITGETAHVNKRDINEVRNLEEQILKNRSK